jgi:protein-tyrosine phosphatase
LSPQVVVAPRRFLNWNDCLNARDLGGYPTEDGRFTRWGAIARCDNPTRLTDAGLRAVVDHGIRTVIDLRKPDEVAEHPNPLRLIPAIRYFNFSMVDPAVPRGDFMTLARDYQEILETFASTVGRIIGEIAQACEGGVLIHCVAGKDRSGLIAALLLRVSGVSSQVVAEDYALSDERLRPWHDHWIASGPGTEDERRLQVARTKATAPVMLAVLNHLDQKHGSVRGYLHHAGLSAGDIEGVRRRLRQ